MEILRDTKTGKIIAMGGSVPEPTGNQERVKTKIDAIPDDLISEDHMVVYNYNKDKDVLVKMSNAEIEQTDDFRKVQEIKKSEDREKLIQDKMRELAIKELEKEGKISQSAASAEGVK